ncbi:hypothetical protein ScPMuIL_004433 [Solemya velum]
MKLVLQYEDKPMKRTVHVHQTDTIKDVLRLMKVKKGTLKLNGRPLTSNSTVRDNRLSSRDRLVLAGSRAVQVKPKVHTRTLPPGAPLGASSCMITLENNSPRSLMSCGHSIKPQSLFEYCLNEVRSGRVEWRCPYIDPKDTNPLFVMCGRVWDMEEVEQKACLSNREKLLFKRHIKQNVREKNRSCNMFQIKYRISRDTENVS